jgi:arylsulfatase A-like enzyme
MPAGPPARRRAAALLLAAGLPLAAAACARFDPGRPDVVLIVVDTLRADHLGAYGYGRPTSPRIDDLARRGTLFESAWSAAPWTLPSVMTIVTGRHASSHRVENDGLKLGAEVPTLAETLRARGYATGGFVSHVYVSGLYGFARGFETFDDFSLTRPDYRLEAGMEPAADRVTEAALAWLKRQGRRPVFLMVHYFDPHWPYDPPAGYADLFPNDYRGPLDAGYDSISKFIDPLVPLPSDYRRFLVDRYDAEVRFVDDQVGRLLDALSAAGRTDRAWVVLTADHGEEFKEHGSMGHGRQLYEEAIRVPLIIARTTPAGGGARVAEPVGGVDLFPTIAGLAGGATAPAGLQGRSLVPLLAAGGSVPGGRAPAGAAPAGPERSLVSETVRLNAYRKAVRRGPLKLIQFMDDNRAELYDLVSDPEERHDLSAARPEERRRLAQALFSEVDVLSGGWNLRWSSDGRPRRFQGQIRTDGIFRTVVPLFHERGKYVIEAGKTLSFTDAGQAGESGISFTVAPYEARVNFYLMIDGRALVEKIFLGAERARPRRLPFALEGRPDNEAAFARPDHRDGRDLGYYLWRNRPASPDQEILLDEEIRARLRSLGYVD